MAPRTPPNPPPRHRRREPRKQPLQERAQVTVAAILEAAALVFEEHGLAGGTTNRIAAKAGVSIGTLYQYFPGKDALAVALVEAHIREGLERLTGWLARARGRDLPEALAILVEGMLALHSARPRLLHIFLEETPLSDRVHALFQRAEQDAADLVADHLQGHPAVRRPLRAAAFMAVQTVLGLTHRFVTHPPEDLPRPAFAAELVALLEAYLTTPPAEPGRDPHPGGSTPG